jgi:hypothetical protein
MNPHPEPASPKIWLRLLKPALLQAGLFVLLSGALRALLEQTFGTLLHRIRPPKAIYRGLFRQVTFRVQISVTRSRLSARQVQELVEAFRSSGLSKAAFSRQHRIAPNCLSRH